MTELSATSCPGKEGHLIIGDAEGIHAGIRVLPLHEETLNPRDSNSALFSGPLDSPIDEDAVQRTELWLLEETETIPIVERAALRNLTPFLIAWATACAAPAQRIAAVLDNSHPEKVTLLRNGHIDGLLAAYFASRSIPCVQQQETTRHRWRRPKIEWSSLLSSPYSSDDASSHRILLASFQVNSTRALLPVAAHLVKGEVPVALLLMPEDRASLKLLAGSNLPQVTLRAPLDPRILTRTTSALYRHHRRLTALRLRQWALSLGIPTWALSDSSLEELSQKARRQLFRSLHASLRIDAALTELVPTSVTYVTHRAIFDELLCAKHPNVGRSLLLQGVVPCIPPIHTRLDVELAIVGSTLDTPYLKRCRIPESRWFISGYPEYDRFKGLDASDCRSELVDATWSPLGTPLIVFTSQYVTSGFPESARLANLKALIRTAHKLPESRFLIRPHPRREEVPQELLNNLPFNVRVSTGGDVAKWLKAADLTVTYWSTTALEALLLGTPLIQLNATGLPDYLQLPSDLEVPIARNSAQLQALITEELGGRGKGTQKNELLGCDPPDGRAAIRAASAIHKSLLV